MRGCTCDIHVGASEARLQSKEMVVNYSSSHTVDGEERNTSCFEDKENSIHSIQKIKMICLPFFCIFLCNQHFVNDVEANSELIEFL